MILQNQKDTKWHKKTKQIGHKPVGDDFRVILVIVDLNLRYCLIWLVCRGTHSCDYRLCWGIVKFLDLLKDDARTVQSGWYDGYNTKIWSNCKLPENICNEISVWLKRVQGLNTYMPFDLNWGSTNPSSDNITFARANKILMVTFSIVKTVVMKASSITTSFFLMNRSQNLNSKISIIM